MLVDSVDDGDFVFFMRQYDGSGRIVLRGSKVLYTFASYKGYGYEDLVSSEEEILRFLLDYGVRFVVVEMPDREGTKPGALLRRLVSTDRFIHRLSVPVVGSPQGTLLYHLEVFEFPEATALGKGSLKLRFPGLSPSVVEVPLGK